MHLFLEMHQVHKTNKYFSLYSDIFKNTVKYWRNIPKFYSGTYLNVNWTSVLFPFASRNEAHIALDQIIEKNHTFKNQKSLFC